MCKNIQDWLTVATHSQGRKSAKGLSARRRSKGPVEGWSPPWCRVRGRVKRLTGLHWRLKMTSRVQPQTALLEETEAGFLLHFPSIPFRGQSSLGWVSTPRTTLSQSSGAFLTEVDMIC